MKKHMNAMNLALSSRLNVKSIFDVSTWPWSIDISVRMRIVGHCVRESEVMLAENQVGFTHSIMN